MTVPFTYWIEDAFSGQRYYGVRTAKGCHPSELFTSYFTSSDVVKMLREYGVETFTAHVHRTFKTAKAALQYEESILTWLQAHKNTAWINRSIGGHLFNVSGRSFKGRPAHNKGKSSWNKGKPQSEKTKAVISASMKGKPRGPRSDETKAAISAGRKGQPAWNKGKPGKKGLVPWNKGKSPSKPPWNKGKTGIPSPKKGKPGIPHTEEAKRNMSEIAKQRWARRHQAAAEAEIERLRHGTG